jgi:tetratricopeptide (TPR) repeat protein
VWLTLAPSSSIIPLADAAAEHRMYLPLAGVSALAVLAASACLKRVVRSDGARRRIGAALAAAAVACLGILTAGRNHVYRSAAAMWQDVLATVPNSARAQNNLGVALADEGRFEEAMPHYEAAMRLRPGDADAYFNSARALQLRGRLSEAAGRYEQVLRINPEDQEAQFQLSTLQRRLWIRRGRSDVSQSPRRRR